MYRLAFVAALAMLTLLLDWLRYGGHRD